MESKKATISKQLIMNSIHEKLGGRLRLSKYSRAIREDAIGLLDSLDAEEIPTDRDDLHELLLSGASDWEQYSYGGCAFVYEEDIAAHYYTPSMVSRALSASVSGKRPLLGMQACALERAELIIRSEIKFNAKRNKA